MIALVISAPISLAFAIAIALAVGTVALADGVVTDGDLRAGEAVYERCAACHSLGHDRAGPRHCGLIGRRAGSVEGYPYSDAMKRSGMVWNEATLDRFLADPVGTLPGTSMGYAGVSSAAERADLIAYLKRAGASSECRP